MKKFLLLAILLSAFIFALPADFGAVLAGQFAAEEYEETETSGKLIFSPWFSYSFDKTDIYISAGMHAEFNDEPIFFPELFRLEIFSRPFAYLWIKAGRIPWQDTSRFTANGIFDGVDVQLEYGNVRLGAAALYTGFLYNESAAINASPGDPKNYGAFTWDDFDTYFAPRRILTSVYAELPDFIFNRGLLNAGLLAQFDLSDAEEKFNTQYLLARYAFVYKSIDFAVSGAMELENTDTNGARTAYALGFESGLQTPAPFKDRLSLGFRWASGDGENVAAFFPVTAESQGVVLKPTLSGIMLLYANYKALLHSTFSAELGGKYFLRTDSVSLMDADIENDSYSLGAEFNASLLWVPVSDLSLSLGAGIFLPQTGEAMRSDAPVRWNVSISTILSF